MDETGRVITPLAFDGAAAQRHVSALCFPRRVGSRNEQRAAQYIAESFAGLGLRLHREPFGVSPFPVEVGSRVVYCCCALLVIAGTWFADTQPLVAAACCTAAAFLVNRAWRLLSGFGRYWPPLALCENLVATLPEDARAAPARVIFMAHYDTKSQFVPTGIRVGLVTGVTVMGGVLAVLALAVGLDLVALLDPIDLWHIGVPAVMMLAGLMANFTGNRSPGALDNGSGVGTLLELARSWRPQPDVLLESVWVATGSEEVGLNGARNFLARHEDWWQEKPTLLINLESVGAGPRLFLAGHPSAVALAEMVAHRLGMAHARLHVLGAGMDHEPFAARGLAALSILGDVVRCSFKMHSARDDLKLIEGSALQRAGRLAGQLAWTWAEAHAPAARPLPSTPDLGSLEEVSLNLSAGAR